MTFRPKDRLPGTETQPRNPWWVGLPCVLAAGLAAAGGLGACEGCKGNLGQHGPEAASSPGPPTVRLYLVTDVAGALEPCGCVKDQLGGLDHAASFIHSEKAAAP